MPKTILTTIDYQGNVHLDFAGYTGSECAQEEERLRRELITLGLQAEIRGRQRKPEEFGQIHHQTLRSSASTS